MTLDIAEFHKNASSFSINKLPLSYTYMVRAAIRHIDDEMPRGDETALHDAKGKLHSSLVEVSRYWDLENV
jgi:hypothetical protein